MSTEIHRPSIPKLLMTLLYILIFLAILLFLSGGWMWIEGWMFTAWFIALSYSAIFYLYRYDPGLLAARYKQPGSANQEGWDKYVVSGLFIGFISWIFFMPLDAKRFGWTTDFPEGLQVLGEIALIFSALFLYRSYTDNTFVSPLVRVQEDRLQEVVSTGVYGFVRHPMYLGGSLLFIGAPLLMGSAYGLKRRSL